MEQCTLLVLSFLCSKDLIDSPNLKGINCTPKLRKKKTKKTNKKKIYIGHRARSRAKDNRSFLPGPLIEKKDRVLGMRACLLNLLIT